MVHGVRLENGRARSYRNRWVRTPTFLVGGHCFGAGRRPSEAAFAPADDQPGRAAWLMTYVHDVASDTSDLVILDAADVEAPPVAAIHLPRRVPFGFHGNWLPDPPEQDAAQSPE